MRKLFAISAILALSVTTSQAATLFWLSGSDSSTAPSEVPQIMANAGGTGQIHVWGRPDGDSTLANLSLNLRSSNPAVLNFTDIVVINPLLGNFGFPPKPTRRYEFVNDPAPEVDPDQIRNFGGFSVTHAAVAGAGMGNLSEALELPLGTYNAAADAFLIASATYNVVGTNGSMTDLYLQIGQNGIVNAGGASRDVNVVFGNASDASLNGEADRQEDSATADAKITVGEGQEPCPPGFHRDPITGECIPEPSTWALAAIGLVGLFGYRMRKQS